VLWLATLGPFVFSFIQNKNFRYTLPILPAAALVAAMGLRSLPAPDQRGTAVAALSMSIFQFPTPPTLPGMIMSPGSGPGLEPGRPAARQDPRRSRSGERWPAGDGGGDSQRQLLLCAELPL